MYVVCLACDEPETVCTAWHPSLGLLSPPHPPPPNTYPITSKSITHEAGEIWEKEACKERSRSCRTCNGFSSFLCLSLLETGGSSQSGKAGDQLSLVPPPPPPVFSPMPPTFFSSHQPGRDRWVWFLVLVKSSALKAQVNVAAQADWLNGHRPSSTAVCRGRSGRYHFDLPRSLGCCEGWAEGTRGLGIVKFLQGAGRPQLEAGGSNKRPLQWI